MYDATVPRVVEAVTVVDAARGTTATGESAERRRSLRGAHAVGRHHPLGVRDLPGMHHAPDAGRASGTGTSQRLGVVMIPRADRPPPRLPFRRHPVRAGPAGPGPRRAGRPGRARDARRDRRDDRPRRCRATGPPGGRGAGSRRRSRPGPPAQARARRVRVARREPAAHRPPGPLLGPRPAGARGLPARVGDVAHPAASVGVPGVQAPARVPRLRRPGRDRRQPAPRARSAIDACRSPSTPDPTPIRPLDLRADRRPDGAGEPLVLEADVVVVGSGAGGGVVAADLSQPAAPSSCSRRARSSPRPEMPTDELGAFDRLYLNHGFNVPWDASIMTLAGTASAAGRSSTG